MNVGKPYYVTCAHCHNTVTVRIIQADGTLLCESCDAAVSDKTLPCEGMQVKAESEGYQAKEKECDRLRTERD